MNRLLCEKVYEKNAVGEMLLEKEEEDFRFVLVIIGGNPADGGRSKTRKQ